MASKLLFIAISVALVSLAMTAAVGPRPSQDMIKAIAAKAVEAYVQELETNQCKLYY